MISDSTLIGVVPALLAGLLALLFAFLKSIRIAKQDPGGRRQREIGRFIR